MEFRSLLPAISLAVILVNVLLIFVIPVFAAMFADFGAKLPAPTQFLIDLSDFLKHNIHWLILGGIGVWWVAKKFIATPKGRRFKDNALVRAPIFGNLIHKIAVVCQKNEAGRVLVQPPNREDPLRVPDFSNDIPFDMRLARRRDPDRFMIFDVDGRRAPGNDLPLAGDHVPGAHPVAQFGHATVDRDGSRLNQAVGLAPRTNPVLRKKLIDADCGSHRARERKPDSRRSVAIGISALGDRP